MDNFSYTNPSIERDEDTPIGAPVHNYWPAPPIRILTKKEESLLDRFSKLINNTSTEDLIKATEIPPEMLMMVATLEMFRHKQLKKNKRATREEAR